MAILVKIKEIIKVKDGISKNNKSGNCIIKKNIVLL